MAEGKRIFGTLLMVPALGACSYESLTVAETDVVLTIEDEGRDYGKLKTYALTDEVYDLCEIAGEDNPLGGGRGIDDCYDVSHRLDDDVLGAIERNMDELGFTRVDREDTPDVVVVVGSVARDNWYYSYGWGWCDPYYYYSCWYPPVSYLYNLPKATFIVNMFAAKEDTGDGAKSAWFAALSGLYETSSEVSGRDRVDRAVDKAFSQSPYLGGDR